MQSTSRALYPKYLHLSYSSQWAGVECFPVLASESSSQLMYILQWLRNVKELFSEIFPVYNVQEGPKHSHVLYTCVEGWWYNSHALMRVVIITDGGSCV